MKNLNIVLAVLSGAVAGAVGLLLAPDKGEHTRRKIVDYLEEKGIRLKKDKMEALVDEIAQELGKK